jgi:insecticidal toxin complex protein TccC
MSPQSWHNSNTPDLYVTDPRGLVIRTVGYCRQDVSQIAESQVTRQVFNAPGQSVAIWDPRLWEHLSKPNVATVFSLSDQTLLVESADAGWEVSLLNDARSLLSSWDARRIERQTDFDDLQRPVVIRERIEGESARSVERYTYGTADTEFANRNQCGRWLRHDDFAGSRDLRDYAMSGAQMVEVRRFLTSLETPDWPSELQMRDALLEDGAGHVSSWTYWASGEMRSLADACGHLRIFNQDVAGQLKEVRLQLAEEGQPPQLMVGAICYNATGQTESETAGNGVVTKLQYGGGDDRPIRLTSAIAGTAPLQDLHYDYDPVGNVRRIEDKAHPVRHGKNQRVDPITSYDHDSLYRLVEVRGRQVLSPSYGPELPERLPVPLDPNQLINYTQAFAYDASGNLLTRHHTGAPTLNMVVCKSSNRCLPVHDESSPPTDENIAAGFDACGNQLQLRPGQTMSWDTRHQLRFATLVSRKTGPDDHERYVYGQRGERLRKIRFTQSARCTLRTEVRYLPGLDIHLESTRGETRLVVSLEAGQSHIRVMLEAQAPSQRQIRFSLRDLLGSCALELDETGRLVSQEGYYAFGGTAWWASVSAQEATYKTRRYSGKTRDPTGLYDFGFRYYAPWLQRWMCPDPAGDSDGLNRYVMVGNNPVSFFDADGRGRVPLGGGSSQPVRDTETLETRITFLDPDLQTRFAAGSEGSKKRFDYVEKEFIHQPILKHGINSSFISDNFNNVYFPHHWIFKHNFRNASTTDYYANDVTRYQYTRIARSQNFYGVLPSLITRSGVMNRETLKATKYLKSGSTQMRHVFLSETKNGKSTQRILNDFGLEATKVERIVDRGRVDFLIHVRPVKRNIESPLDNATALPTGAIDYSRYTSAAAAEQPAFTLFDRSAPSPRSSRGCFASLRRIFR